MTYNISKKQLAEVHLKVQLSPHSNERNSTHNLAVINTLGIGGS